MTIDQRMRKLAHPVDARSSRGLFSRGKAVYRGGSNAPHRGILKRAAARKLKANGPTRLK